jgi:hypothetical protein
VTRGGPGAAPSRWGTWRSWCCPEPRGHLGASELPLAGRREPFLTWSLYVGVPGPQGTDKLHIVY